MNSASFRPVTGRGSGQRSAVSQSGECPDCAALAEENRELRRVVEKQRKMIERLRRRIDRARNFCDAVYWRAESIMSHHQPRGTWSLWRGCGAVAAKVDNMLSGED